ncbi:MAG: thiol protease/hemagglutinin PrtT [Bacteroidetes bacterium]|nr:thiol protease/hemagglutinin PrtT [Bacteroidota bacterium]
MKKIYLLLTSVLLAFVVFAKDVDPNVAKQVALHFYIQNTDRDPSSVSLQLVYANKAASHVGRATDGAPVYYVFSVSGNAGFVVVSGDDLVQPVLAYSTSGSFSAENLNPTTRKWMEGYAQQILFVKENRTATTDEINRLWNCYINNTPATDASRGAQAVNPLCQTQWNQAPNENGLCPYSNQYSARCVTGCVATAMAQILKFWNYPTQGTGFHSYNDQNFGTLSANFGSTTYNWAGMPNTLGAPDNDVATLMLHCGVSVDMNYGVAQTGGSSAYVVSSQSPIQACAEYAYKTYFGYDPATLQGVVRQNYSESQWKALLKAELDAGRPLQYAGFGNGGGHTWVLDGYDNNDFFHQNWGWGGNSDGFFSINNLDPTSLGAGGGTGGFNGSQQAVIGIKPLGGGGGGGGGGGTINQDGVALYSQITVSANPVQSGSAFDVNVDIANAGTAPFTGDFAAALFTNDGVFVEFIQEYVGQTINNGFYSSATFSTAQLSLIPGTYILGVFYKNGSNNYSLINPSTYNNPVSITVTGPPNNIVMNGNTSFSPATVVKNAAFNINTNMANTGANLTNGFLSADLYDANGDYVVNIEEFGGVNMTNGNAYNVQFVSNNGLNVDPGTYYVAFFSSPDGQNWNLVYGLNFPNPVKVTIVDQSVSPDVYENNDTEGAAYTLATNFSGNNASTGTPGSTVHVGNDYDYYKLNLPGGNNYSITARVHDSYSSSNGQNYSNDVQFSYQIDNGGLSTAYDDVMPGPIYVPGGGTVLFFVSDYFSGTTGSYLLDLQIVRGANVGVDDLTSDNLTVYPNPAKDILYLDMKDKAGNYTLRLLNVSGQLVQEEQGITSGGKLATDVSQLARGVYTVQLHAAGNVYRSKLIVE